MTTIDYRGDGRVEERDLERSLLEISLSHKIPHMHECGGHGRCTTCRVRVLEGREHLSPRSRREEELARERGWDDYTRLACQCRTDGPITIERLVRTTVDLHRLWAEAFPQRGIERHVVVLFSDIRGFTPFAKSHLPHDVMHLLNGYFAHVCEPILNNNGYIDKYLGDGVLALFGLRQSDGPTVCRDAVRAALGMIQAADAFGRGMEQEFGTAFRTGVGLHYGVAITGVVGHPARPQFTAIGDTVNVACRIEAQNKRLGTRFLASPELVQMLEGELKCQPHSSPTGLLFEITDFARPDTILLVQQTAALALADPERFARAFYDRLFEVAPQVRGLFTGDIAAQGRMFVQMIQTTIAGLSRLDELKPGLIEMGRRHAGYGVHDEHYPVARAVLLDTLRALLGESLTPAAAEAWGSMFDTLADLMLRGTAVAEAAVATVAAEPVT